MVMFLCFQVAKQLHMNQPTKFFLVGQYKCVITLCVNHALIRAKAIKHIV